MWQDSSVGIVTRPWAGRSRNRGSIPGKDKRFSLLYIVHTNSGAHLASYTVGTGCCFPGSKAARCEADHVPSSSAEVKNTWSYTSIPVALC
jgi:hypothetical protein